jgi:dipeptidyl-peptidase-3
MKTKCIAAGLAALAIAACSGGSSSENAASTAAPAAARSTAPGPAGDRKYLLDRVDDAAIVQLYADGFNELPLKDKTLVWHLYQAAIAGRDIFFDL